MGVLRGVAIPCPCVVAPVWAGHLCGGGYGGDCGGGDGIVVVYHGQGVVAVTLVLPAPVWYRKDVRHALPVCVGGVC